MICTFYSFKGGVGRSMALANLAEILYHRGLKVLMVDFDLEAPGLEQFFNVKEASFTPMEVLSKRGLIDMLLSYKELRSLPLLSVSQTNNAEITQSFVFPFPVEPLTNFIVPIYKENNPGGALSIIPAGRRSKDEFAYYAEQIRIFNWNDFFLNWDGELFFEWFRQEAKSNADVILIDSRTGVTEMGGICTHQLADVVVTFAAPNQQNLSGTFSVAYSLSKPDLIQEGRKGRALSLLFVPSRVEQAEKSLLDRYEEQFNQTLGGFVPPNLKFEKNLFTDLKIPYIPFYAYEENVAVREADRSSAFDLVKAFERLAYTLAQIAPNTHPLSQLYQVDQNKLVTIETPPVTNFSSLIDASTQDFIGRQWVFDAVNKWLADPASSRFFILSGAPGSGKTAIASRLVQFSQSTVTTPPALTMFTSGFLSASHFCSAQDIRTITPHVFVESLAIQLASRYPAFARALSEKGADRQVRILVEQRVQEGTPGQMIGVVITSLSVSEGPQENAFNRIVREPLESLFKESSSLQVIILVDGLDEAYAYNGEKNILSLLSQARNFPPSVRFIVTTRPHTDVIRLLKRSDASEYSLTSSEGLLQSQEDVRQYVLETLSRKPTLSMKLIPTLSLDTFVAAIQTKSEGNLLYIRFLLETLEAQSKINWESLDLLPEGIDRIYIEFLERLVGDEQDVWEKKYAPVLGTMTVACEPLTEDLLADIVGMKKADIRQVLKSFRQFLDVDDALPASERTYTIFHSSFANFLLDEDKAEEYWCEAKEQHLRIIKWCEREGLSTIWVDVNRNQIEQGRREYVRRNYITHLYHAREWDQLFDVLDTAKYGEAKVQYYASVLTILF